MKKVILLIPVLFIGTALFADEKEPVCEKCQRIRAYNAAHPENNYFYYDDYLKDQEKKHAAQNKPETKSSTKDVADTSKPAPSPKK